MVDLHTEKIMNKHNELANDNRGQHIKKRVMGGRYYLIQYK